MLVAFHAVSYWLILCGLEIVSIGTVISEIGFFGGWPVNNLSVGLHSQPGMVFRLRYDSFSGGTSIFACSTFACWACFRVVLAVHISK